MATHVSSKNGAESNSDAGTVVNQSPKSKTKPCAQCADAYWRHLLCLREQRRIETAGFQVVAILTMLEYAARDWAQRECADQPAVAHFLQHVEDAANAAAKRVSDMQDYAERTQEHLRHHLPFFTDEMLDEEIRRIRSERGGPKND